MNEACLNARWIKEDLTHEAAQAFTIEVLNHMRTRLSDYQELYGDLYNLEATPAESTSFRLAKHDKQRYPDIITASSDEKVPFYTNSSHLPVGFTEDIFQALDIEDKFQTLYTSGTVFHCFLGQKLPDYKSCMKLVRKIAENYKLPYYTMSPTYSVCAEHGYLQGEQWKCPICGKEAEVYSRITGYYRPVKNWNAGKTQEFKQRREYVPEHSTDPVIKEGASCSCGHEHVQATEAPKITQPMLFTSPTCPNCKMAKMLLDKDSIHYENVDAVANKELTEAFGIKQAPTLLVPEGDGYRLYENASNIKGFIEANKGSK